jgi:hypothetical protein
MARRNLAPNSCVDCGNGKSDMTCPVNEPLDELLDALADQGFEAHFNEIDARVARSPFCVWLFTRYTSARALRSVFPRASGTLGTEVEKPTS